MGGHGGLNILPQKRWNVYNYENREKVRQDEEAAAKQEQLHRDQSRKRDAEFRIERLRSARGLPPSILPSSSTSSFSDSNSGHINLFDGIKVFDFDGHKSGSRGDTIRDSESNKKRTKETLPRLVTPDDEKYRLGYGVAGRGVKLPWYAEKRHSSGSLESEESLRPVILEPDGVKISGKKTIQQLREERLKREENEKRREMSLKMGMKQKKWH